MAFRARIGLLLHFYQPFWQSQQVLDQIVRECYLPIFRWVNSRPGFAFSANIQWSLIELLIKHDHRELLEMMRRTVADGKVELFGTAAHHPILPLLTREEQERQLVFDRESKKRAGFPIATCGGIYLPEYAWDPKIVPALKGSGGQFTVVDDALFAHVHGGKVPFNRLPLVKGLAVFLRSRLWGDKISLGENGRRHCDFDRLARELPSGLHNWFGDQDGYFVLAFDAETFGHHVKNFVEWLLIPLVDHWGHGAEPVGIAPFQDLYGIYAPLSEERDVPAGTWSTEISQYHAGVPFPLWDDSANAYHRALWKLVDIARQFGERPEASEDVMKVLSSCAWWQVAYHSGPLNAKYMMPNARLARDVIERCGDEAAKKAGRAAFKALLKLPGVYDK